MGVLFIIIIISATVVWYSRSRPKQSSISAKKGV